MKKWLKTRTSLLSATIGSALVISAALLYPPTSSAQIPGLLKPFGGRITYVDYCCNGIVLSVTGPTGINNDSYFLSYADVANPTVNYANYQTYYGGAQSVVGIAAGVAVCSEISEDCMGISTVSGGQILKIGTSMPGL